MKNKSYISKSHLNYKSVIKSKKPNWIRVKAPNSKGYLVTKNIIKKLNLNTVCEEAACPNIGECWSQKHATIMILGNICTRKCAFCNIQTGIPQKVDRKEPKNIAKAISRLNLNHVVITSVDRDDLKDGGAGHFVKCVNEIRKTSPSTTIEILTPDFQRKPDAIDMIAKSEPDVFNHNLETISRLYKNIRRGASYQHSLNLLKLIKLKNKKIWTKSGLMVGLGENIEEIVDVMDDMRRHLIDFITIGQYLQPTTSHHPVVKYISLNDFKYLEKIAWKKGFSMVSCSPLTRSSYHADEDFIKLKNNFNNY